MNTIFDFSDWNTREVKIGDVIIGGNNPISVQSMTNTSNLDIEASVNQCIRLVNAGCEIIRLAAPSLKDVRAISEIKYRLKDQHIHIPLVADVHFNPEIAFEAAKVVEKVRINPGNFVKGIVNHFYTKAEFQREFQETKTKLSQLIEICQKHQTAIRIGANHGSLSPRMLNKYGDTIEGMVESVMEYIRIANELGFHQLVISLKSSNVKVNVAAYRLLVQKQMQEGFNYPIHLGVTEAGSGQYGRVKSAIGIGALLEEGIGDTIRVSLTEAPENEILSAMLIANRYRNTEAGIDASLSKDEYVIQHAIEIGTLLLQNSSANYTFSRSDFSAEFINQLEDDILQACRIKQTKTEIISCPSCARTLFNIEELSEKVKAELGHLKHLKIAVMGCIVNGPGEMADADYGLVGSALEMVNVYKGKRVISRGIPSNDAISELMKVIQYYGDWVGK